ncbi:TPA: antitermination protein [Escherichia coli]
MNNLMVIDGIEVRRDAYGRYSLNDLHRAAVASGANARTKEPGKFLSSQQTVELVHELTNTQNLGVDPVSVIHGGNERGTYVCKELVYAYAMWISPSFHLKVIRTFDMVTSAPEKLSGQAADKMQAGVILLDFMRRELNLKELCQHCHGKGEVSTACRGCKGKGIVLDEKRTRLHGTPVYKICGRCNGNRFSRLPTTLARHHVQKLVPDLTDYQWYKGYADVIDKLVTKCWQEEAYAEIQLRNVTR